ncbi:glycine cleavage system protein GcvH [Nocardia sp. NPDC051570]|uniref:glycine cleavage system protein GcvH n=1 Tax=Nocardia sp. NPDC051570 TaxID=3364324 RepID=UPI00379DD6EF
MSFPEHLQYTEEHEWLDTDGDVATVGVTGFAASSLGDIVFVQLPSVGDRVVRGETCGEIESTKSVSDLYAPVSGEVVEVNDVVVEEPELVNTDPYGTGWLFRVRVEETGDLLDAAAYAVLTGA